MKEHSDPKTKEWFEEYLKGAIQYRGVKTPKVFLLLKNWHKSLRLDNLDPHDQLEIATNLIRQKFAEDKFAGIIYIQNFLIDEIELDVLVAEFEKLFDELCFFDWSTTDWFNVRVLSPLINLHGRKAIKRIVPWHKSDNIWQRRSSIVALRPCVKQPELVPILEKQIQRLVTSSERFIQTGIGWVIADLAKSNPQEAARIVENCLDDLSMEVVRRHTKNLAKHKLYIKEKKCRK